MPNSTVNQYIAANFSRSLSSHPSDAKPISYEKSAKSL